MIKLLDIIKEIVAESKAVKVPEDVLGDLGKAYDYITANIDDISSKAPEDFTDPYIPSNFNKSLKLKDLSGKDIEVSIGFYNNPKDAGAGRMDTRKDIMLVNLPYLGDKQSFVDLGEHELVHAMDPKVRDVQLFGREYAKKGAEPSGNKFVLSKSNPDQKSEFDKNMEKYSKSPWEFDAFTAPMVSKLGKSYNKVGNKKAFKQNLFRLFSEIKDKSIDDILKDEDLLSTAWFFSSRDWKQENWDGVLGDFRNSLSNIKSWTTKPTLYKRFLQRVASEIN
jgi:hypothetical protein